MVKCLHPHVCTELVTLHSLLDDPSLRYVSVIDISYVPTPSLPIHAWFLFLGTLFTAATTFPSKLRIMIAWIPTEFLPTDVKDSCIHSLMKCVPDNWTMSCSCHNAVNYGDPIIAQRYVIPFIASIHNDSATSDESIIDVPSYGF